MFCTYFYQLRCEQNEWFQEAIDKSWNMIDYNQTPNIMYKNYEFENLDVSLIINATDQVSTLYFQFLDVGRYYRSRDFE